MSIAVAPDDSISRTLDCQSAGSYEVLLNPSPRVLICPLERPGGIQPLGKRNWNTSFCQGAPEQDRLTQSGKVVKYSLKCSSVCRKEGMPYDLHTCHHSQTDFSPPLSSPDMSNGVYMVLCSDAVVCIVFWQGQNAC